MSLVSNNGIGVRNTSSHLVSSGLDHRLPPIHDVYAAQTLSEFLPTNRVRPSPSQEEEIKKKKPSRPPTLFGVAENLLMARILFVGKYYFQIGLGDTGNLLCEVLRRSRWFDYKTRSLENVSEEQKFAKVKTRLSRVHELKVDTLSFWLQFDYPQGSDVDLYLSIEDLCLALFKEKRQQLDNEEENAVAAAALIADKTGLVDPSVVEASNAEAKLLKTKPKGGRKTTTIEEVARRFAGSNYATLTGADETILHDTVKTELPEKKEADKRLRFAKCEEIMVKHWLIQGGIEGARTRVIEAYSDLPRPTMGDSDAYQRVRKVYQKMRQELTGTFLDLPSGDKDFHYDPSKPDLRSLGPIPHQELAEFENRLSQRKRELISQQDLMPMPMVPAAVQYHHPHVQSPPHLSEHMAISTQAVAAAVAAVPHHSEPESESQIADGDEAANKLDIMNAWRSPEGAVSVTDSDVKIGHKRKNSSNLQSDQASKLRSK